jgi:hypothetical protein
MTIPSKRDVLSRARILWVTDAGMKKAPQAFEIA